MRRRLHNSRANRTLSELLRRRYKAEQELDAINAYGRARAAEIGITEADVVPLIHQLRKEQRESGLVFGGTPRAVLLLALTEHFILCISNPIQAEAERTLAVKFSWTTDQIRRACDPYWKIAEQASPATALAIVTADRDDDRILECAVDGQAKAITHRWYPHYDPEKIP